LRGRCKTVKEEKLVVGSTPWTSKTIKKNDVPARAPKETSRQRENNDKGKRKRRLGGILGTYYKCSQSTRWVPQGIRSELDPRKNRDERRKKFLKCI